MNNARRFAMLVLSRKQGESIRINDNITIKIVRVGQGRVQIAIDAPKHVTILREELVNGQSDCVLPVVPVDGVVAL
jgi:carbon storage regulator